MANQVTTVSYTLPSAAAGSLDLGAIDGDFSQVLSKVFSPDANRGQYIARLDKQPNIVCEAVVDNGLTPVATKMFDLTALGLTFPTTTKRLIRWRHWVQTDNDLYYTEYSRWVLGGTTPVLLGSRRVIDSEGDVAGTIYAYGQLQLHATTSGGTVTVDTTQTSQGLSLGNFTSGAAALTFGPSRATPSATFAHFAEDAGTIGDVRTIQIRALVVAGTGTVETFTSNGTEAISSPNQVNNIDLGLFVLPPGDADLVMNGNSAELRITGIASDETRHRVDMFIGAPVLVPFQGS